MSLNFISSDSAEEVLAHAFNVRGQSTFQRLLEMVYEPEVLAAELESLEQMLKLAAVSAAKVLKSSTVKIDLSLAAKPNSVLGKFSRSILC